ncbi:hypothetical protein G9A89_014629 [Geosiphon pyriformis]|nr:hypothetical protein G9A89_014629 [Geosiphon pyriformis]
MEVFNDQIDVALPSLEQDSSSLLSVDSSVATPPEEPLITDSMIQEESRLQNESCEKENLKTLKEKAVADYDALVNRQRVQRLRFLLEKSTLYAGFLAEKMERQQKDQRERAVQEEKKRASGSEKKQRCSAVPTRRSARAGVKHEEDLTEQSITATGPSKLKVEVKQEEESTEQPITTTDSSKPKATKRKANFSREDYNIADFVDSDDLAKRRKNDDSTAIPVGSNSPKEEIQVKPTPSIRQPSLVTGGVLREYQLAGFEWLVSLYDNGLNGILADEMGLGKTLQTIAFFAYLWERQIYGPFLIVAPLSTLANWISEFHRFTPTLPVVLYHGTPEQRTHLRNKRMKKLDDSFPIVVTSYEIVMNDRKYLQRYSWKYIVVDEGHRIKNLNCKLIKELKSYNSANRLLLTGTPLQNNLAELWSLLNFLLPDIFDDWENFQTWFNFSALNEKDGQEKILAEEQENMIITNLHTILKPFLLRRLKSDVEYDLPKKREYLLYAPITQEQKELYDAVISKNIRSFLIDKKTASSQNESLIMSMDVDIVKEDITWNDESSTEQKKSSQRKSLRTSDPKEYNESLSDRKYFDKLEKSVAQAEEKAAAKSIADVDSQERQRQRAVKRVGSLNLQNAIMQLRKVCNHPYLFDWPSDPTTQELVLSEELVTSSGKMMLLDRLLPALFERGHKVLIFSQFTTMLDIIEDWATKIKGWKNCRIDGGVKQDERREQIQQFNTDPQLRLFILSTRAGGLGINLTAADTVIIFDSDWNPQMDLQAQDRVHRIGQTKPVIIYRLVSANTVESKILEKATAKRKLEKLVIHKGKFKAPSSRESYTSSLAELAEILNATDSEKVQLVQKGDIIIPDDELERILDRSDKAFEKTEIGMQEEGTIFKSMLETKDDQNNALAQIGRD